MECVADNNGCKSTFSIIGLGNAVVVSCRQLRTRFYQARIIKLSRHTNVEGCIVVETHNIIFITRQHRTRCCRIIAAVKRTRKMFAGERPNVFAEPPCWASSVRFHAPWERQSEIRRTCVQINTEVLWRRSKRYVEVVKVLRGVPPKTNAAWAVTAGNTGSCRTRY